ncbi:hypothetical protein BEWA_025200 [Theileria equi strain WA]|uniref:Uncharacterized protein n=1 Tax=Theileria equi strain WA TaxID=1537102 RepID=L0AXB8_THEEQ|nr:hypothetical protein BEWA_025200 [Theileria equi strain WA]AFZ79671.1 hypothetical protein BEWA_025200 [Theileria equi strain WA]|eukprot:XP_004829337.1 hypothetical protein BEWA_025200 [Theileria equi strain WA]
MSVIRPKDGGELDNLEKNREDHHEFMKTASNYTDPISEERYSSSSNLAADFGTVNRPGPNAGVNSGYGTGGPRKENSIDTYINNFVNKNEAYKAVIANPGTPILNNTASSGDSNMDASLLSNSDFPVDRGYGNEIDSVRDDTSRYTGTSKYREIDPCETQADENVNADLHISRFMRYNTTSNASLDDCTLPFYYNTHSKDDPVSTRERDVIGNIESMSIRENRHPISSGTPNNITSHYSNEPGEQEGSWDKLWDLKTLLHDANNPKGPDPLKEIRSGVSYPDPTLSDENLSSDSGPEFFRESVPHRPSEDSAHIFQQAGNVDDEKEPKSALGHYVPMDSGDQITLEIYKFELEKVKKITDVLKKQIAQKDEEISKLNGQVHEFQIWKSELDTSKHASVIQYKAESDAVVAINFAKLQAQIEETQRLANKLQEMEEQHRIKDDEIRALRERVMENELVAKRYDRDVASLSIDKQMLKNSIADMEKTFKQREMQLKLNLDVEYQNQLASILKEQDQLVGLIADKDSEIEKCKTLLKNAQKECSQLLQAIVKLKEIIMRKNQELGHFKEKVIELESSLIVNDKTSELRVALKNQDTLRERIRELEYKLERLQESASMHDKVKEENFYLQAKIHKLESRFSLADGKNVMEFSNEKHNQMLPLSLANFSLKKS